MNVISVVKDASSSCTSTPCVVFYIVGCIGALLAAIFTVHFGKRSKAVIEEWISMNQEWILPDQQRPRTEPSKEKEEIKTKGTSATYTTHGMITIV